MPSLLLKDLNGGRDLNLEKLYTCGALEFLDIQVGGLLVSNSMTFDHKRSGNLG